MAHSRCCRDSLRRLLGGRHVSPASARIGSPLIFAAQGLRFRKLEVILTTNIEKLGKAGETVKVAPGHFRNHLMPKMLAVPNIDKYAFLIREQRKLYQREDEEVAAEVPKDQDDAELLKEEKMKEYQTAAKRLDSARLVLRRLIKVDNELLSPVMKEEIVAEVARQLSINFHPDNLHLPSPIESLGEYEIPLRLPREIPRPEGTLQWTLNLKIRRK